MGTDSPGAGRALVSGEELRGGSVTGRGVLLDQPKGTLAEGGPGCRHHLGEGVDNEESHRRRSDMGDG